MSDRAASPSATSGHANIALRLDAHIRQRPDQDAIIVARAGRLHETYARISFAELGRRIDGAAAALAAAGIRRGDRTVLMVKPGFDFFALVFALFKLGAVVALIDPGLGVRNLARCLAQITPRAFVGIPKAHVFRLLYRRWFASLDVLVTVGGPRLWGGHSLAALMPAAPQPFAAVPTSPGDPAAILFTSGSTGAPKGALYRHECFTTQVDLLASELGFAPGEIDVATFPLFALFDVALGMTSVIPDMDATRPGRVAPPRILRPLDDLRATTLFGSPALVERVTRGTPALGVLRRVVSVGAPVHRRLLAALEVSLPPTAEMMTPYGATEALPVAIATRRDLLSPEIEAITAAGGGVLVGRPVRGLDVRILETSDDPVPQLAAASVLATDEVGEIIVSGPQVTWEYASNPDATHAAKIREGDRVWHRMGDLGRLDAQGRLWFYGRRVHRVSTARGVLYSVAIEAIFNRIPGIRRTALVGLGSRPSQRPVLVVELLAPEERAWADVLGDLRALAPRHAACAGLDVFLRHPGFPVDIRHNAKIDREALARWASTTGG